MTQDNKPKSFFNMWFNKTPGTERDVKNVRILHRTVEDITQTTTHLRFFDRKDGKKGAYRVECAKKDFFGDLRDKTECPLCTIEKYPQNRKYWAWVEDLDTPNSIKYIELPYSAVQSIEMVTSQVLSVGSPLWNVPLQVIKSGERLSTTYTVIPMGQEQPYDIAALLAANGLTDLPDLFGEPGGEGFPPIWRLDADGLVQNAQGIHPWQLKQSAPAVQEAQRSSFEAQTGQQGFTGHTPKQVVQQPTYNPTQTFSPRPNAVPQPAPTPGAVPQPVPTPGAVPNKHQEPNLTAIHSDPLPASFSPLQEHVPHVPYSSNGEQEVEADLESLDDSYTQLF